MRYVDLPIVDKTNPTSAQISEFLKIVNDPATGKFYVHYAGGRHRTGVMAAVYRFNHDHWNYDQAYAEMLKYDFYTSNGHGKQLTFVQDYWHKSRQKTSALLQLQLVVVNDSRIITAIEPLDLEWLCLIVRVNAWNGSSKPVRVSAEGRSTQISNFGKL